MSTLYLMTRTPGGGYVKEVRTVVRTLPVSVAKAGWGHRVRGV